MICDPYVAKHSGLFQIVEHVDSVHSNHIFLKTKGA